MSDILNYFNENKDGIIGVLTAIVAAASAICALTPTPKDDSIVRKAYVIVEWLALNVGKAKDK
jgi:hypothetical protein|tara:strand:- start:1781 stop:1969 length:189 start_codon:yes stop_codon:yes gene_type:complete